MAVAADPASDKAFGAEAEKEGNRHAKEKRKKTYYSKGKKKRKASGYRGDRRQIGEKGNGEKQEEDASKGGPPKNITKRIRQKLLYRQ